MAREYFKNLPDKTTPLSASRINGLLNGEESIEKIVVGKIENKNIFNKENVEIGYRLDAAGSLFALDGYFCSFFIEVSPNTIYTGNWTFGAFENICYYTSDKIFIERNMTEATFTTPENAAYIRMCGPISEIGNRQLEKGSVVTEYTPYKEFSNKQIYSTEEQVIGTWMGKPLYRKVYNDLTLNSQLVDVSILSIETLVDIYGICYSSQYNQYKKANLYQNASDYVILKYSKRNERIDCDFTSAYTSINLVLEYTKTTD